MASARQMFVGALLVLAVASMASGARQLQQYGRVYAERRPEDKSTRCLGFGNVGQCMPICNFLDDKVVNGFDESITFTAQLMDLNVSSGDTLYTTCDPISGDISDYSTNEVGHGWAMGPGGSRLAGACVSRMSYRTALSRAG